MKVDQQRHHLLAGEAAGKAGHHSLPCQHILAHGGVGCGNPTGQRFTVEDAVQVRRDFLERQVVVLVTMGATSLVKVLAFGLLRGKCRCSMAASECEAVAGCQPNANNQYTSGAAHRRDRYSFVVSHPCASKKAQGWGMEGFE